MIFPIDRFKARKTPFYYYDTRLLNATLDAIERELDGFDNFNIHYAVKANANPDILAIIANRGFGADCVSGEEIDAAVAAGIA
ncbi:MAG TPA: diaminopimelate decarboxylase, partial [Candidatus Avibacteroides avistercoris]|nr:diaminopimelate decarboxylase [Candidatus Avibacteroides avistercoris]